MNGARIVLCRAEVRTDHEIIRIGGTGRFTLLGSKVTGGAHLYRDDGIGLVETCRGKVLVDLLHAVHPDPYGVVTVALGDLGLPEPVVIAVPYRSGIVGSVVVVVENL